MFRYSFFREREPRYRTLWVSPELLMGALFAPRRRGDRVTLVKVEGVPEDCEIVAVCYDEMRRAFGLRLWHESFDPVELGRVAPEVVARCGFETVRVTDGPTAVGWLADAPEDQPGGRPAAKDEPRPPRRGYEFL